jgi:hypothetical protein
MNESAPTSAKERVVVTDIEMPFGSMVRFMIKWALASIPAALILVTIVVVAAAGIGTVGGLITASVARRGRYASEGANREVAPTSNDPSGIARSGKVYLDGAHMLFHEPGCAAVGRLISPMEYDRDAAIANGYRAHICVR